MGAVERWTGRWIRVPRDLPMNARWVMDGYLDPDMTYGGGNAVDEWFWPGTMEAFRKLGSIHRLRSKRWRPRPRRFIVVDGKQLSYVRNVLYYEVINGESECDYYVEHEGVRVDVETGLCLECHYDKCLVMLWRIDHWMDRSNAYRPVYLDPTESVETLWRRVWGGPSPLAA